MSSNALGTMFRIVIIFAAVISLWLAVVGTLYWLVCAVIGTAPSPQGFALTFAAVVLFRTFVPRNVFR